MRANVIENPALKLEVYAKPNCWRNTSKRTKIQVSRAIVGVEPIHAKSSDRKPTALTAAWRTCNNDHSRMFVLIHQNRCRRPHAYLRGVRALGGGPFHQ